MMICFSNHKYKHNLLIRKIFLPTSYIWKDTETIQQERTMSER